MSATTIPSLEAVDAPWHMNPSKVSVVKAVGQRMVPYLIEATLIPTVLFYVFFITLDLRWAIVAALGWTYAATGRRIVTGRRVPGLLVLAIVGISVRTVIYLLSGNDFVYFFQPIMRTVATGAVFALSVCLGRPLIARFAADFCPLSPDVQIRPAVVQLFRRLTYLWAAVNVVSAAGDADAAADGAGRRVRRHGDGLGVGHHVHRRRAHGVGLGPHGPAGRAPHHGRPERQIARIRRRVRLTSASVSVARRRDVECSSATPGRRPARWQRLQPSVEPPSRRDEGIVAKEP